jgi:hypothetical protein
MIIIRTTRGLSAKVLGTIIIVIILLLLSGISLSAVIKVAAAHSKILQFNLNHTYRWYV